MTFISGEIESFVEGLKNRTGKNIWLVGGSEVIHSFMSHDLIDEFVISVHPIILGDGILLFRAPLPTRKLSFQKSQAFDTGLVQITYIPQPVPDNEFEKI